MKSIALPPFLAFTTSTLAEPLPLRQSTCPKTYDPKCSHICGQKSIDFWYCSSEDIWPIPSDDNYCTPCPRSRTARDVRKRLLAPRRLVNLSEVGANACPNKKDETCRFICGKEGIDILFCSEKNIYENLVLNPGEKKNEGNWCAACK
ncbi:hypothetical protein TWF192_000229 [Orbilia oligospora]|uniref:Uncharacterized protein n=1 Tax=Orbilia oligospora TaxID=2813651 RepID=A0A6G1MP82_ORBOL|nr:hypothetical protein TWF191_000495 [Orbilia oligospora]KAF3220771.1 hypothetical protein TWF679_008964 [Orbilia oligospora]KAF3265580.1 hypothetical protein TWF192_000229 [Orbilia oligospora]